MRCFISAVLQQTEDRIAVVAVQRSTRKGHVTERESALMYRLYPHFRPAYAMRKLLGAPAPTRELFENALDLLSDGIALLRKDGGIVFDNRAGFGEHELAVGDHGGSSDRMQRLVGRRRQHGPGIARRVLELIGNAELLAEPDDPFRSRLAEMMDGEHETPPRTYCKARQRYAVGSLLVKEGGRARLHDAAAGAAAQ